MAREVLCIARKGGSLLEKLSVFLEMSRVYGVDYKYDGTLSNFQILLTSPPSLTKKQTCVLFINHIFCLS